MSYPDESLANLYKEGPRKIAPTGSTTTKLEGSHYNMLTDTWRTDDISISTEMKKIMRIRN